MSTTDFSQPNCITLIAANDNRPGNKRFRVRVLQQGVDREMLVQVFGILTNGVGTAFTPANDNVAGCGGQAE